ncbi:unannotated protein [freshwater metagenome]|uniref:Unannotated protein n=1 Tax=freshwater metagenome TaxID=449393 RepID=A0A6J7KIU9_9ZZZZ
MDWPKPQNAQPTTQTFDRLTLRLTTNETVSPARDRRSSSAAMRISSTATGSRSTKRAVSSCSESATPSRAFSSAGPTSPGSTTNGASDRPDVPRGMKVQYFTVIVSSTAGSIQSALMYSP